MKGTVKASKKSNRFNDRKADQTDTKADRYKRETYSTDRQAVR